MEISSERAIHPGAPTKVDEGTYINVTLVMSNILVFGTGAIGSVYASILCRAGVPVTCVCRSSYDAVKSNGLRIRSTIFGELYTRPNVVKSVHEALSVSRKPFNFIVVCTKATFQSTSAALEAIEAAVLPEATTIVLIQNGLGVEKAYHQAFPWVQIISGVAYLPTTQLYPGVFLALGNRTPLSRAILTTSVKHVGLISVPTLLLPTFDSRESHSRIERRHPGTEMDQNSGQWRSESDLRALALPRPTVDRRLEPSGDALARCHA